MEREGGRDDFVVVQRFMWHDLGLSGVTLLVYARIYGFCQSGKRDFYESKGNTAEYFDVSERMVYRAMRELVEKGLVHEIGTFRLGSGRETKRYRIDRAKAAGASKTSAASSGTVTGAPTPDKMPPEGRASPDISSGMAHPTPDKDSGVTLNRCHPIRKNDNKGFR